MIANTYLARWRSGQVEIKDAASITARGRFEAGLSVGDVGDMTAVEQVARSNMGVTKAPTESAIAQMYDLDPADGHSAYTDYQNGDTVTVLGSSVRCASITVSEDENAYLDVVPEFVTARDVEEQRVNRWLSRTNGGALAGQTASTSTVSVTSESVHSSDVASPAEILFSTSGDYELIVGDAPAPGKTPSIAGFLYRVEMDAVAAGVGDTDIEFTINGSPVCTVTLAASSVATVYDLTNAETLIVEPGDIARLEVLTAGGHTGVAVRLLIASIEI